MKTEQAKEQIPTIAKEKEYPAIISLQCEKNKITATLSDRRITSVPTAWFKSRWQASLDQLQNFEITPFGYGIHWPEIDEDISVKAFVEGLKS